MPVFENGCEPGQQVLDGWGHLGHSNDIHNGLESTKNGAQHLWVLLTQVLIQHNSQMPQQLLLITGLSNTNTSISNSGSKCEPNTAC